MLPGEDRRPPHTLGLAQHPVATARNESVAEFALMNNPVAVFDTLATFSSGDENDNSEMGATFKSLRYPDRKRGICRNLQNT
jgi:hypothetical protein